MIAVGGATDVLIALSQGARRVVGVDVNPVTVHATRDVYDTYLGTNEGLEPGPRLAVLRGLGYGWATVLVKREPFTAEEAAAPRDFARRSRFPLLYDPLASDGDPTFTRMVREGATPDGDHDLRPATDDWPFFFLNFRWRSLPRAFAVAVLYAAAFALSRRL
jgi:hypothetical protein